MKKIVNLVVSIHPILFAIFPVLFLYEQNKERLLLQVILVPLVVALSSSLALWLGLSFILRNTGKGALVTSTFLVLFFSYGHMFRLFNGFHLALGRYNFNPNLLVFAIYTLPFFFLGYLFLKRKNLSKLMGFAGITGLALVAISICKILPYEIRSRRLLEVLNQNLPAAYVGQSDFGGEKRPDIYYIILDRYASAHTLRDFYGFENSDFLEFLREKGFYIASESYANYPSTSHSLSSSLNMRYLDDYFQGESFKGFGDWTPLYNLIENNEVQKFLRERGYRIVQLGSWWEPTMNNQYADENLIYTQDPLNEFSVQLIRLTPLTLFPSKLFLSSVGWETPVDFSALTGGTDLHRLFHREIALYQFDKLKEIPDTLKGPKFVFAHILLPHEPYVFDQDGGFLTPEDAGGRSELSNYLGQLIFTNRKVEGLLEILFEKTRGQAVVILQSDEGPHPIVYNPGGEFAYGSGSYPWKDATEEMLKEKMGILNAYYLPGFDSNLLYPSITPVNSFRLIFNFYFDANFELLPDKNNVFEDREHPYRFKDVTTMIRPE